MQDERYRAKYGELAASLGFTDEFLSAYNLRLKISVDKVWTTRPDRGLIPSLRSPEVTGLRRHSHVELAHAFGDDGDRTGGVLHLAAYQ